MRDSRIEVAIDLIKLEQPDIKTTELVQEVLKEFGIECTEQDIHAIYASYLPDNFEAESKIIQYYERSFVCELE